MSRARRSVSAAFLVHAGVFGTWAPRLPAIKHHLHLDHGQIGGALTGAAVGFLVGTRVSGPVARRLGSGPSTRAGALVACATLLGPALAGNLAALTGSLVALGAAGGFLDVAMNTQGVLVERRYRQPIMSTFHALWSLGTMAAAVVAGAAAAAGVDVRVHFGVVAAALAVASVAATRGLVPPEEEHAGMPEPASAQTARSRRTMASAAVVLGLVAFCSLVGEGSASDWSAVYLRENIGASPGLAAAGFAAFSLAMACVRFAADRLSAGFGPVAVVRIGAIAAAAGLALAVPGNDAATGVAGFALLGAGLGPAVPTAFSAAGNTPAGRGRTALAGVVTAGYLGAIVGPLAIGFTADVVGLRTALWIPAALAAAIVAGAGSLSTAAG